MNICILTQPLTINYGGLLQAYAMQKVLKSMGHEVTTLRFKPLYAQSSNPLELYWKTFRRYLSKLKGNKGIIRSNPERQWEYYKSINETMEHFIHEHIHTLDANAPLKYKDLPVFDAFIVGSDQVWRPVYSPCLPNFYFDFVKDNHPVRIAYAASFGVDHWEVSEKQTKVLRELIHRFDRISVREVSGLSLCKKYLDVESSLMPDPTMLLTRDDYLELCPNRPSDIPDHPYIATYIIDPNSQIRALISSYAEKSHLPVVPVGQFNWKTGSDSMDHWIQGIANASCLITDSFHGTLFALLIQKDFLTFDNSWRGPSRFHTLLDAFGLSDRLVQANQISDIEIRPLDKESVARILSIQREKGLAFLAEATAGHLH